MATKKTTAAKKAVKPKVKAAAKPKTTAAVKPKAKAIAKAKTTAIAKPKAAAPAKTAGGEAARASLVIGAKAPDFKLIADNGSTISLADLAGKNVVLYFYPKDNTPGCTRQACSFQENLGALTRRGAVVIGVSRDSAKSHAGFKTKYGLAFPLLVDADAALHKAYGAWGSKVMYGKERIGALRSTVIIDKKGRITKVYSTVKVDGHTEQVLAALDGITG